jgi:predicted GIY-YIG superfamily endonuclease
MVCYVYILQGERGSKVVYYVWQTDNLLRRLDKHRKGTTFYTKSMSNKKLIWYFLMENRHEARKLELKIKKSKNIKRRISKEWFIKQEINID